MKSIEYVKFKRKFQVLGIWIPKTFFVAKNKEGLQMSKKKKKRRNKGRCQKEWSLMINFGESKKIAEKFGLNNVTEGVYRAIRTFKNNKTHTAFPELETIAKVSGYCKNTVIKHIKILEDKGIIIKQRRKIRNSKGVLRDTSNLYTFVVEKFGRATVTKHSEEVLIQDDSREDKEKTVKKLSPLERLDWVKNELIGFGEYTNKQINKAYLQIKEEIYKGNHIQSMSSYITVTLENLVAHEEFKKEERERLKSIREFNAGKREAFLF